MHSLNYLNRVPGYLPPPTLVCGLLLLLAGAGHAQQQTLPGDRPGEIDRSDGPTTAVRFQDFPNTEIGRQLTAHLNYMSGVGRDAEQKYQESLKKLRSQAPKVIPVLFTAYLKISGDRYFRRWAIVETMREVGSDAAQAPLERIASAPIPEEHWADPERFSVDKEIHIRVTAIMGLGQLARQGNKLAEAALLRFINHGNLSIRREAIRGYLAAGTDYEKRAVFLRSKLPKRDHGLITLGTTKVKQIPHPDDVPEGLKPRQRTKDDPAPRARRMVGFSETGDLERTLLVQPVSFLLSPASCIWQPGDNNDSGDNFYGPFTCNQIYIDQFWDHFDFDKDDWDDGFGWEAACDRNRPLARTFNALYLLAYSAEDYATSTSDFSGNALRWGYPYAASHIDELDGRCGSGNKNTGARATTYWGLGVDDRTVLKWPFFYGEVVVERAGTVLHESRHAAGKDHNGGSSCPRMASCDSSWGYKGANMYQVLYLWWFYVDGTRTTTGMRNYARQEGQRIIDRGFVTNPGYVI